MKTDRFSDSIRRKLESIRPDFKEKDWARMQATLLQHTTPPPSGSPTGFQPVAGSVWSAQPWLLAAAVSTAVLVGVAVWQRNQINELRQTVSQLSRQKTATLPRQTPSETTVPNTATPPTARKTDQRNASETSPLAQPTDQNVATANRPDTIYINRYVPVPASPSPGPTAQRLARPDGIEPGSKGATDRFSSSPDAQPQQSQTSQPATGQRNDVAVVDPPVETSRTNSVTDAIPNGTTNRAESTSRPTRSTKQQTDVASRRLSAVNTRNRKRRSSTSAATDAVAVREGSTPAAPAQPTDVNISTEAAAAPASSYELATSRPLTMKSTDWSKFLAHRVRQVRQMQPERATVVGGQAAPESQPISPIAFGFRIGAGAEVTRSVRSGSVLGELLVGNHLTLGLGLGMGSFAGGTFITDVEFDRKKHQNFRHNYARGIHPRSDIINIATHTERLLIPITVGYRVPVSQSLSLLPSIGTTLNLQTHEFVTFTYRQPFRTFEAANYRIFRPVDLINALNFGAGVEWKRNHWVWQAGPVVTVTTKADPNWKDGSTVGLRARLFYQF